LSAQPIVHVTHQLADQAVGRRADLDLVRELQKQPPVDNFTAGGQRVVTVEGRVAWQQQQQQHTMTAN
jgi:hypothetical protein